MKLRGGGYRWMETTYRRLPDGRTVGVVRDTQRRKETEEQLEEALRRVERLAMHDPLTNLPNRRCFLDALQRRLAGPSDCAVLLIDLDRFKAVNDVHGHVVGDQVLQEVARRLRAVVGKGSVIARLGGDEFAALLEGEDMARLAGGVADAIVRSLCVPMAIGRAVLELGASVGIALGPRDGADTGSLLRRADAAMYHAKRSGQTSHHFFEPGLDTEVLERAELQMELRHAIAAGEIVPYYHPLFDLREGRMVGLEALARWEHPERGTLPPSIFIPLVEKMGLCDALFRVILTRVCRDAAAWPTDLHISVNLSPQQLVDADLPRRIRALISQFRFDPRRLVLEVTESLPVNDSRAARQVLADIRACGIAIALDDFGTGHSSLSLLQELKFDKLKIDRSFVTPLVSDSCNHRYLKAIIGLGQSLDLEITAEGIETAETMRSLRDLGCAVGQGYLYGKPAPASAVPAMVRRFGLEVLHLEG
jgi:diguanylate cyclase (GGDEF)-like protein